MIKTYTSWPTKESDGLPESFVTTPDLPIGFNFNSIDHDENDDLIIIASTFSGFDWTGWTEKP